MLSIYLLGQPHLEQDGTSLQLNAPPKTVPLLAYILLHRGQALERQQVAMQIWPDESEQAARTNLRRHLHWLGKNLPETDPLQPWLLTTNGTLRWNPQSTYWLDVEEFEKCLGSPQCFEQAVALYRGDLMETNYDDWVLFERERVREQYFQALHKLIVQERTQCRYGEAIHYAQILLNHDPFREDTIRQLMAIRYEAGDRAGALAEFDRFAGQLKKEMGVSPMPETLGLHETILRYGQIPGARYSSAVADEASNPKKKQLMLPMVGRQAEMERMKTRWSRAARGYGGLMLLSGEAGIGKTRITQELALLAESQGARILRGTTANPELHPYQAVTEAFQGALALLASLEGEQTRLSALAVILPELKKRRNLVVVPVLAPEQEKIRLYDAAVGCLEKLAAPRPVLLILEDLHWAGESTLAMLEFITHNLENKAVLVVGTYREEEVHRGHPLRKMRRNLEAANLVDHLALSRLSIQAVEKLIQHIERGDGMENPADRLYTASEGHPLFLSLLVNQWQETGELPGEKVLHNIQAVIEQRISVLSPQGRSYAEVASVLGQVFDPEVTREVGGWGEAQALDALGELLDRHLARDVEKHTEYQFAHHLIQSVLYNTITPVKRKNRHRRAAEILEELYPQQLDEMAAALANHFDLGGSATRAIPYYLSTAKESLKVYADSEALAVLDRALVLANTPGENTIPLFMRLELLLQREEIFDRLGRRAEQLADLQSLEILLANQRSSDFYFVYLQRMIKYWHAINDRQEEWKAIEILRGQSDGNQQLKGASLFAMGSYHEMTSEYQKAIRQYLEAMQVFQQLNDLAGQQRCAIRIAATYIYLRDVNQIDYWVAKALKIKPDQINFVQTVDLLYIAAVNARNRKEIQLGLQYAQQMVDISEKAHAINSRGNGHRLLGQIYSGIFEIEKAFYHFDAALHAFHLNQNFNIYAATLGGIAALELDLGRYQDAWDHYFAALKIAERINSLDLESRECINLSYTAAFMEKYTVEKEYARRAVTLARKLNNSLLEAFALNNLGEAERELGELDASLEHLNASWVSYQYAHRTVDGAGTLVDLALTHLLLGDYDAARQDARALEEIFVELEGKTSDEQRTLWAAARVWNAAGDLAHAKEIIEKAHAIVNRKLELIPDQETRLAFCNIIYNRQIIQYHQTGSFM
ncbi:MAG: hypothetical protein CVU39_14305 [Chloroflexi bacterium HGW-Chloroflexi-10]|nr:MAG: hypothetical protein CVU39_14305 [Chloroflexi bacterium HGW-Chloroflexi-10]